MDETNTIKFARYLQGWSFEHGSKADLVKRAKKISTQEYQQSMKGHIFCPACSSPLFRSPEEKDYATNGRRAFFAHSRGIQTECRLRVRQTEGKNYVNEEEARRAMEEDKLVVVHSFMKDRPKPPAIDGPTFYDREPNEDRNGPTTQLPIGRHNGEEFKLPSRITTIRGLCRSFDENLSKYFVLPGQRAAHMLRDQLTPVSTVTAMNAVPALYVGRIKHSRNMGRTPQNVRQTFLQFPRGEFADFCLKATDESSREHGIDDDSVGRIVLAYGAVTDSGVGLCIKNLGWGEFALLPAKYEYLVDSV